MSLLCQQPALFTKTPLPDISQLEQLARFELRNEISQINQIYNIPEALNEDVEDETLESDWHVAAMSLLINILRDWWSECDNVYISGNTSIYFDPQQTKQRHFRGPDLYVIKGAQKKQRRSWVIWEEGGLTPNFILELASISTMQFDVTGKKTIYEQQLKTPEYVIYNPTNNMLRGWRLKNGSYVPMEPNAQGQLWCEELGLWLGIAPYNFKDGEGPVDTPRFFDPMGQLVLTEAEMQTQQAVTAKQEAATAKQRASIAEQQAAQELQRAERLAQRLRMLGIDPDSEN